MTASVFCVLNLFMLEVNSVLLVMRVKAGACKALNPSLVRLGEDIRTAASGGCCALTEEHHQPTAHLKRNVQFA